MAVTHSTVARNAATNSVVDLIDVGTANSTGRIVIKETATTLVVLNFSVTAFGDSSDGSASANAITNGTATGVGIANSFEVINRDAVVVLSGSVSMSGAGGDLILDNTSITENQTVSISSFTYAALSS